MSVNAAGRGCTRHSPADPMRIYDRLPPEVRRAVQLYPVNLCVSCVASKVRRHGVEWVLERLAAAGEELRR
jgi:hypothetical protein